MGVIQKLFATKIECERLHQAALAVLLAEPGLLERLCGLRVNGPRVVWEPEGGEFDLSIESAEHPRVLIELKLDDNLTRPRIERQLAHIRKVPGQQVLYLLLGVSGLSRGLHWPDWSYVYTKVERPLVRTSTELRAALAACRADSSDAEWRELAENYEQVLLDLEGRTGKFVGKAAGKRLGETMTIGACASVGLTDSHQDAGLLAQLVAAEQFVAGIVAACAR